MPRLAALLSALLVVPALPAAEVGRPGPAMDPAVKEATARGLDWLARTQNADGSWSGHDSYKHNTALTGFVLLAFLSQGHTPTQGKYAPEVAKGVRFLVASAREDGYLAGAYNPGKTAMYGHGMATLVLTQVFGLTGDEEVRKVLRRAVDLILRAQSDGGGWRYSPHPGDADISVTIMQVMALRGAKDGGLHVPDRVLQKALEYVDACFHADTGGYTYQAHHGSPGFARTAAGVCVIKLAGAYERRVEPAVAFLKERLKKPGEYYWYGHYYAAHAFHQVGGKEWDEYYRFICREFLASQTKEGSWDYRSQEAGKCYSTAVAVISLSVPAGYLPIFQR